MLTLFGVYRCIVFYENTQWFPQVIVYCSTLVECLLTCGKFLDFLLKCYKFVYIMVYQVAAISPLKS
jgi:hypothetical protein